MLSFLFISRQELVHPTGSTSFFAVTDTAQREKETRKRNAVLTHLGLNMNVNWKHKQAAEIE